MSGRRIVHLGAFRLLRRVERGMVLRQFACVRLELPEYRTLLKYYQYAGGMMFAQL